MINKKRHLGGEVSHGLELFEEGGQEEGGEEEDDGPEEDVGDEGTFEAAGRNPGSPPEGPDIPGDPERDFSSG